MGTAGFAVAAGVAGFATATGAGFAAAGAAGVGVGFEAGVASVMERIVGWLERPLQAEPRRGRQKPLIAG